MPTKKIIQGPLITIITMMKMMTISNILGVGTDIIEVDRIRTTLQSHGERFFERLLTAKEKTYCLSFADPAPRLAGRFAAKEAIVKALGCGFGEKASWRDIEIINDSQGKPEATLLPPLQQFFQDVCFFLSISHCKTYATATAICVRK